MPMIIGPPESGNDDQEQPGVNDNPSGYTKPGGGYDPDGDGVLNPARAARVGENHNVRESAGSGNFALDADAMRALLPAGKTSATDSADSWTTRTYSRT